MITWKNENGVELTGGGTYPATLTPAYKNESSSLEVAYGDKVTLHNGQSITIYGLPIGEYEVQELGGNNYIKFPNDGVANGPLWKNDESKVTFINIPKQNLIISKQVYQDGNLLPNEDPKANDEFEFTVSLTDGGGTPLTDQYTYRKHKHQNGEEIPISNSSQSIVHGGKIQLHHNECAIIQGLPAGAKYKVEETGYPGGYIPTSTIEGIIETEHEARAVFENMATNEAPDPDHGYLRISKEVYDSDSGEPIIDDSQKFEFKVDLMDKNGHRLAGEYHYSGSYEGVISSGGTIKLAHEQQIVIEKLPVGAQYIVTETATDGYIVDGEYREAGTIEAGDRIYHVEFVNIRQSGTPEPPKEPDPPTEPDKPEDPTTPTRRPSGGGGGGGGGGSDNPTPPSPTDPSPEPPTEAATEPGEPEPELPGQPEYPTELPDPNDPDSPDRITILENGVPRTYLKCWNPDTREYVYLFEDEVPLSFMLPNTGDKFDKLFWLAIWGLSLSGLLMLICMKKEGMPGDK